MNKDAAEDGPRGDSDTSKKNKGPKRSKTEHIKINATIDIQPDKIPAGSTFKCNGLHLKTAVLAFNAISSSNYLQMKTLSSSHYLQMSLQLFMLARIPFSRAHINCK